MSAPTVVSLYTGAGGLDMGFVRAGFAPIYSNDIDADSMDTYDEWMAQAQRLFAHLEGITHISEVADSSTLEHLPDEADVVIGGPPCQGFSVAGHMDPTDPRSRQVWRFLSAVRHISPRAFVMENVAALAQNKRWEGIKVGMIAMAESLGYTVTLRVLNAADYGVPQNRLRMFLIGVKEGVAVPAPTTQESLVGKTLLSALERLPAWGEPGNDTLCSAKITPAKQPVLRQSPWAGMLFNGAGRPMHPHRPAPTLPASMGGNRTPIIDQQEIAGEEGWVPQYHKHLMEGGSPIDEIPSRLRRITVEEAAAIQTFPQGLHWHGKQSSQYQQIGNAVPPRLAEAVAQTVKEALEGTQS